MIARRPVISWQKGHSDFNLHRPLSSRWGRRYNTTRDHVPMDKEDNTTTTRRGEIWGNNILKTMGGLLTTAASAVFLAAAGLVYLQFYERSTLKRIRTKFGPGDPVLNLIPPRDDSLSDITRFKTIVRDVELEEGTEGY